MQKTILTKDFECKHTNLVQQEKSFKSFNYSLLLIVNHTILLPSFVIDMSSLRVCLDTIYFAETENLLLKVL